MKTSIKKFLIISLICNLSFLLLQIILTILLTLLKTTWHLQNNDLSQIFFGILIAIILVMFITHWVLVRIPIRKTMLAPSLLAWQEELGITLMSKYPFLKTERDAYIWYLKRIGFFLILTLGINFGYALITAVVFSVLG